MDIKETNVSNIIDSRERCVVCCFDETEQILTMKNANREIRYNLEKAEDRKKLMNNLRLSIRPNGEKQKHPAEYLISHGLKLSHVILTQKSMDMFVLASDNLLDKKYLQELYEKKFHKQDVPISSRNLNDWIHTQKLLPDDRTTTEQWHAFSKIDIAYIYVLKACREFGISLRFLHNAKESLLTYIPNTKFCLLEIAYTCFDKSKETGDIFLYMDSTGHCNIARIEDIVIMAKEKMINKNFILNLSEVWREM